MEGKNTFRIILYQKPLGINIPEEDIIEMRNFEPHFVCFPEYFFVDQQLGNHKQTPQNQQKQLERIRSLSITLETVVIGGTMPELSGELLYNTSFVYDNGMLLGSYRKKHLFFAEEGKIIPGESYRVFSAYGITFGVLICADVFHDESFTFMKEQGAAVIFSPTFSPAKEESVEEKYKRDKKIYVRGAAIADSVIVKVCGVKSDYISYIQARSLLADREKILYRVDPKEENTPLIIKKEIIL
ncbi:MAG: carbon-nitrogen hydrolase family protein [bacterium]|nr:carbon-nitrogen hydrolase family protein [bacterium]